MAPASPFWRPVDMSQTALLLSDVQDQLIKSMPADAAKQYLETVKTIVEHFRSQVEIKRGGTSPASDSHAPNAGVPLIIHHLWPFGQNSNAFVSPYNKLTTLGFRRRQGMSLPAGAKDPNTPWYAIPEVLIPPKGWNVDEVILGKIQCGSFIETNLLQYLRARDIKHVVLCGLKTDGAVLSSVREASDLDFHVILPREGSWAEPDIHNFIMDNLMSKFCDVVSKEEVLQLV